jgi:hypothetical protein
MTSEYQHGIKPRGLVSPCEPWSEREARDLEKRLKRKKKQKNGNGKRWWKRWKRWKRRKEEYSKRPGVGLGSA